MDEPIASRSGRRLANYEDAVWRAIEEGRIPGAVAMVGNEREVVYASAFGHPAAWTGARTPSTTCS
jgi:hypothetical protein